MFNVNPIATPPQMDLPAIVLPSAALPASELMRAESDLNPYNRGFKSLDGHMAFLAQRAYTYYQLLDSKNQIAKEGQGYLEWVNKKIEEYRSGYVFPPGDMLRFLEKHLGKNFPDPSWTTWNMDYELKELGELQGALDGFVSAQVDFVSESQLQVQRMMQSYNTAVTFMNSLQSSLTEMVKTLIQGIR